MDCTARFTRRTLTLRPILTAVIASRATATVCA
jgi:hypothetical protein